ncbi:TIGR02452 family protein [Tuwongella immobilis]|uniref:Microbial-type PARG catalytic domain-containing protein n=1 Tax=Tuwongella immobilis TaxID=692036 RepID=A0A6C2YLZ3_9BACT|nr:TIGR02452 family protein [Tuwongella immobilis]VIP01942.1 Putative uncharacterized protein OS=Brevibacillus brevis (strain 47 / JCM 6285 / NBRC 100599) GN=BBR47_15260 PE=4 SV=1: DUF2263 [Tuwongella immobilis]VTR99914.1 Putative uncharacterized protein OS=Brevibacillus brevis (strain 47 / JCM 6285 / NBRC 100599) GN=BBR47_15260 PE=4 SV=1: DUF2263 [Tuwongella immobilis]
MSKRDRQQLAEQTVAVLEQGWYLNGLGERIDLTETLAAARDGTVDYPSGSALPRLPSADASTQFEVTNESTLQALIRLNDEGETRVGVLNFASAKNPGGGFLGGAQAQEESLARSSGLYPCLCRSEMYDFHRQQRDLRYSDWVVYSPDVPVIRDDSGDWLPRPILAGMLTCPAVNAGEYLRHQPRAQSEIAGIMRKRCQRVLQVAAAHRHQTLILGAWGCGVFRNDPKMIAECFRDALMGSCHGLFNRVVFAILDNSSAQSSLAAFHALFRG